MAYEYLLLWFPNPNEEENEGEDKIFTSTILKPTPSKK